MHLIKYYTCKKYLKTSCIIYQVNPRTLQEVTRSVEFTSDQLPMMLKLHTVKNAIYSCCEKIGHIRVLNNPIH